MQQQKIIFLNKVLLIIVITLIIYLVISIILLFYPKQESVVNSVVNRDTSKIWDVSLFTTPFTPLSHYEKVSSGRLFTSLVSTPSIPSSSPSLLKVKEEPSLIEKPVVAEPEITFKLIGIIWGEKGANTLIKSSQEPQTQLVTIGDKISGYQVVNITEEAVILSKGNERKVVRLEYSE